MYVNVNEINLDFGASFIFSQKVGL